MTWSLRNDFGVCITAIIIIIIIIIIINPLNAELNPIC